MGTSRWRCFSPSTCGKLRDELKDSPVVANIRLKALRALFSWAVEEEEAPHDPTFGVKAIKHVSKGFHSWEFHEIEEFENRHPVGSKARLAMALLLYTACRREDVVRLGPQHVRDGRIRYRQAKNEHRNPVDLNIPVHPDLKADHRRNTIQPPHVLDDGIWSLVHAGRFWQQISRVVQRGRPLALLGARPAESGSSAACGARRHGARDHGDHRPSVARGSRALHACGAARETGRRGDAKFKPRTDLSHPNRKWDNSPKKFWIFKGAREAWRSREESNLRPSV